MPMLKQEEFLERTITTGKNFAYLKIGEGCSNKCTYCAIPYIRGPFVSRKKGNTRVDYNSARYDEIWNGFIWGKQISRFVRRN